MLHITAGPRDRRAVSSVTERRIHILILVRVGIGLWRVWLGLGLGVLNWG